MIKNLQHVTIWKTQSMKTDMKAISTYICEIDSQIGNVSVRKKLLLMIEPNPFKDHVSKLHIVYVQMRATKTAAYYISPIEIGVL